MKMNVCFAGLLNLEKLTKANMLPHVNHTVHYRPNVSYVTPPYEKRGGYGARSMIDMKTAVSSVIRIWKTGTAHGAKSITCMKMNVRFASLLKLKKLLEAEILPLVNHTMLCRANVSCVTLPCGKKDGSGVKSTTDMKIGVSFAIRNWKTRTAHGVKSITCMKTNASFVVRTRKVLLMMTGTPSDYGVMNMAFMKTNA